MTVLPGLLKAQYFDWASTFGGSHTEIGHALEVNAEGHAIAGITFGFGADMYPGPGTLVFPVNGITDFVLAKFDHDGMPIWMHQIGGNGPDQCNDLHIDHDGSFIATGYFRFTMDLDPGTGTFTVQSGAQQSAFIAKYDTDGAFLWGGSVGGDGMDTGHDVTTDLQGNHYLSGHFNGQADLDPGPNSLMVQSLGLIDAFIIKLDSAGGLLWAKTIGDVYGNDIAYHTVTDYEGNLFIAGYVTGQVDLDPGTGVHLSGTFGSTSAFLVKLDTAGEFVWGHTFGGGGTAYAYETCLDSTGNIYLCGTFYGSGDFDPHEGVHTLASEGSSDAFVLKLDPAGHLLWAHAIGGIGQDGFEAMKVLPNGTLFAAGHISATVDADPGSANVPFTSAEQTDAFLLILETDGSYRWAGILENTRQGRFMELDLSDEGEIYLAGAHNGPTDFDPGPDVVLAGVFYGDLDDGFVMKLGRCNGSVFLSLDGETPACEGDTLTLSVADVGSGLQWSTGEDTQTIEVTESGIYSVTVQNAEGCPDTYGAMDIEMEGANVSVTVQGTQLIAYPQDLSYQWYFNGTPIEGATGNVHVPESSGNFWATWTDDNGCSGQTWTIEYTHTSVEYLGEATWGIRPGNIRPFEAWQIVSQTPVIWARVLDVTGRAICEAAPSAGSSTILNIPPVGSGTYCVQVATRQGVSAVRVIVM